MKSLLVFVLSIYLSSSTLLPTDLIASVHLVQNEQLHPLSQIYEDPHTLEHKDNAVISLKFAGHEYTLDLTKGDNIIAPDFVHIKDDGTTNVDHNLFEHCAYSGIVRGIPHSEAHLFTCGGILYGTMRIHNTVFSLLEKEGQTVVIVHDKIEEVEEKVGEGKEEEHEHEEEGIELPFNSSDVPQKREAAQTHVLSIWSVISPSAKKKWAEYGWTVENAVRTEYFILNELYKPLGLRIQCVGIFESKELYSVVQTSSENQQVANLRAFNAWQRQQPKPVRDWAFYQTGLAGIGVGIAVFGAGCGGGGNGNIGRPHVYTWSKTFAHELGHALGMHHDGEGGNTVAKCCPDRACIMDEAEANIAQLKFGPCSVQSFKTWVAKSQTCIKPIKCTYGEWGPWDKDTCGAGWRSRVRSASSGCVGPREIQPTKICDAPTPPRMGFVFATPNEVTVWACDPNKFGTIKVEVQVPGRTTVYTHVPGNPTSDHYGLWGAKCPTTTSVPASEQRYSYRFDLRPPVAVGTKLSITAYGVNNAGALDGRNLEIKGVVAAAPPKAVSAQDNDPSSEEKVQTNSVPVQVLVGVVAGCSVFVIVVIVVVAVVLSKRTNRSEERA